MPTTRRDFFKGSGPAVMAGIFGFPGLTGTRAGAAAFTTPATAGQSDPAVASNGYLWSLLPADNLDELRHINVTLTELAIQQCKIDRVANQIEFDTLFCEELAIFEAHGVSAARLIVISRHYDVVFPWSLTYGGVRATFNARFVRLPLAIAFPRTVDDVVFWVNFVRDQGFGVSVRSGNNCYESFDIDNEIVIDLTFLALDGSGRQFLLDRANEVVHVAPGIRLGVLYTELFERGVRIGGGQCPVVCVGGLVGTGGVGYSTRELGYMCDQLVEVEYVLADGSVVVANAANEHADLFRATKGAGAAGLGVMTRLSVQVVPARKVLFYALAFDMSDAPVVIEKWQNLAATAPDGLSSVANFGSATAAGATPLLVNGEYPVANGDVAAARQGNSRASSGTDGSVRPAFPRSPSRSMP